MADAEKQETDPAPDGQRTLQAPEGCGFQDAPVLPVQVQLMCKECETQMVCVASVPPLIISANPTGPPMPDYLHQCPGCEKKVRMKQPFPMIRYAPHPTFAVATPEQLAEQQAEMAERAVEQLAALEELTAQAPEEDQPSLDTSPVSEASTDSSSEEE